MSRSAWGGPPNKQGDLDQAMAAYRAALERDRRRADAYAAPGGPPRQAGQVPRVGRALSQGPGDATRRPRHLLRHGL